MTLARTTLAALLAVATAAVMAVALVPSASADRGDDRGERRISATSGVGLKAASAAKKRVGGGAVRRVRIDTDDADRYEVVVRRGSFVYEVDLSRTFKVRDVERERVGGDRDDDRDDRDDDDRDDRDDRDDDD